MKTPEDRDTAANQSADSIPVESDARHRIAERLPALARACHQRMARPLSNDELDEAIQDAALVAWQRRRSFRGDSSFETWLYGIARICILKTRRRAARSRHLELASIERNQEAEEVQPGSRFDTGLQEAIHREMGGAGTTLCEIVRAHSVEGLTFAQIGKRLSMTESAAKQRYVRGLPKVRRRLHRFWLDIRS